LFCDSRNAITLARHSLCKRKKENVPPRGNECARRKEKEREREREGEKKKAARESNKAGGGESSRPDLFKQMQRP